MLCRNFELILIKIGFFTNFLSCSKIGSNKIPCTIVHGLGPNFVKNEKERFCIFIAFSD